MKIVLISAPMWSRYHPLMGINSVGQALKDHGHDVTFFDVNVAIGYQGEQSIWESGNSPLWYREDLFTEKVFPIIKDNLNREIDKIMDMLHGDKYIPCSIFL